MQQYNVKSVIVRPLYLHLHDVRMYDAGVQIVTWQKQVLFRQFFSYGSTSFEYEHVRFETRHARNQCAPARPGFIVVR